MYLAIDFKGNSTPSLSESSDCFSSLDIFLFSWDFVLCKMPLNSSV